ncbi:cytidylate kinase [Variovorax boronicumulans]|uniref:hypothetical protein n=1 Tax=Variovorax boronicumulans TaxID=436515 RepID=UPI0027872E18|nr:hypothetical protein [Variovorax boronicumulans]MDP9995092.1 cytidylate kinase [Variovorax boronicumulans]MDQ0006292.1 cytidylate kinase [Variovorax boronicumulans]
MKLVFIHGPVASGKLTIARELGRLSGLAVFHNHLVVDAVARAVAAGRGTGFRLTCSGGNGPRCLRAR